MQEHGTLMSGAAIDTHTHTHTHTHETLLSGSAAKDIPHDMGTHTHTYTKTHDWIDCSCCKEISNTLPKARTPYDRLGTLL